jgi:hypothetical protein
MKTMFINAKKLSLIYEAVNYRRHFVSPLFLTGYIVSYTRLVVQSNAYNFLCSSTYHNIIMLVIYIPSDVPCHMKQEYMWVRGKEFNGCQDMKYFRYYAHIRPPWTMTLTILLFHYA